MAYVPNEVSWFWFKKNRSLEWRKSWRSCYFWPLDRSKRRLSTKEHQSVKMNFSCSLLIRWYTVWRIKTRRDLLELHNISPSPIRWRPPSLCPKLWVVCAVSLQHLRVAWEKAGRMGMVEQLRCWPRRCGALTQEGELNDWMPWMTPVSVEEVAS